MNSGRPRRAHDDYPSDPWTLDHLFKYYTFSDRIWEPACGAGNYLVDGIAQRMPHATVYDTDIIKGEDFFQFDRTPIGFHHRQGLASIVGPVDCDIITNPPYYCLHEFVEHALKLTKPYGGKVAMLCYHRMDTARGRFSILRDHPAFDGKITLCRRMKVPGFADDSPKYNHAWYVWDWSRDQTQPPKMYWEY